MKRPFMVRISTLGVTTAAIVLTSCSTPQTRISEHPDLYQTLSHRDQALVTKGQIRIGMSRSAVWLAWGSPDRKIIGNLGSGRQETWAYVYYATYPSYPCYGPWDQYLGAPLYYDPCYLCIPASIPYPNKVVTFAHDRVASFQYLAAQ